MRTVTVLRVSAATSAGVPGFSPVGLGVAVGGSAELVSPDAAGFLRVML